MACPLTSSEPRAALAYLPASFNTLDFIVA
jgi:hypothetical protein